MPSLLQDDPPVGHSEPLSQRLNVVCEEKLQCPLCCRMIHLWDVLTHSVVWSNDVGEQAQSAAFSPDGEVIVVGTVTGKWVVLDINTREVFGVHQDGSEPVHVVKFSPDGSLLAIGSRDNAIYMYQVGRQNRFFLFKGTVSQDAFFQSKCLL